MRAALRRAIHWGNRGRRLALRVADPFPVTLLGLLLLGVSELALRRYAYAQMDMVLLVAGWTGRGLVGVSVVLVALVAIWIKLRARAAGRGAGPLESETGRVTRTGFSMHSFGWMPFVQLRWEWESPEGVRVEPVQSFGRLSEGVVFSDRGEVRGARRRIVVQDAFGLARVAIRKDDEASFDVEPHVGALRSMPVLASLAGGDEMPHPMGIDDGDRVELRRYVPGDPARFIHWKVFGRTRKLMVRVPERALSRARRTVAYLVAGRDDGPVAACARVAVEGDAFGGDWVFGADGSDEVVSDPGEARRLIVRSGDARERGAERLSSFVERAERDGPASVVVFAPPRPGPWLDRVVALARKRRRGMRVVLAVDGLATEPRPGWVERLFTVAEPPRATPSEDLDAVLRALGGARCEVAVFDRPSGRQLGAAHRRGARAASALSRAA